MSLQVSQPEAASELLARRKARSSLLEFTLYTKPDYEVNWHHQLLCEYLDKFASGEIKRLMVFMPPRHGKSELVSRRLPAYLFGKNPDCSIISCSYSADLASRMNRDVQRIIDTPRYCNLFPETRLSAENIRKNAQGSYLRNSDIFEVIGHTGAYRSAGVGGGITGMGCNFGIIDDPIKNREEAESETYREKTWEWYTSTFYTRLEKDAQILVTQTRWHEDDLSGRILEGEEEWTVVNFPAFAEDPISSEDPRQLGEPLWPGKYDAAQLAQIKTVLGSHQFTALYQQRPTAMEGEEIKRKWWRFYKALPNNLDEMIQSWDCSFKDLKKSDYVSGQVWGRKGADKYLIDRVHDRLDMPGTIQAILTISAKWPKSHAKLVEDKANGPAVIQVMKHSVPGLIAVEPEGGKVSRVRAISPDIEAGNVYLPDPSIAPWIHDFIEECSAFPNGKYDDDVDAMSQALARWAMKPPITGKRFPIGGADRK